MIIVHEGVPGSGKSYDAIRKIIDALKHGRAVYTNIDGVDLPECREYICGFLGCTRPALDLLLYHLSDDEVRHFWDVCPEGSFIVIDEAQLYFNSRDFAKAENRKFGDWASTHRHHGNDLLLITQRAARIDTSVRSLSEFRYRYRKLNVFGSLIKKGYLVYTFCGEDPQHMRIEKRSYDPQIFPCYNSYVGDATEKKVQKNPNLLNHPIFYLLAACLVAMAYFIPQSQLFSGDLSQIASGDTKDKNPQLEKSSLLSPKSTSAAVAPATAGQAAVDSATLGQKPVFVHLDSYLRLGDRVIISSNGVILRKYVSYDLDTMTARILPDDLPLSLKKS